MSTTELITFKFRRGVALQWSNANPILSQGEPGYETDTGLLKMGDGLTPWNSLNYYSDVLNPNGAVSLGLFAGTTGQLSNAIAIGTYAGTTGQKTGSIAIGNGAATSNQGIGSIALGNVSGSINQGNSSIAIGTFAGFRNQPSNTIILNASGITLSGSTANAFYVRPIRTDLTQTVPLCYNSSTGEIVVGPTATNNNGGLGGSSQGLSGYVQLSTGNGGFTGLTGLQFSNQTLYLNNIDTFNEGFLNIGNINTTEIRLGIDGDNMTRVSNLVVEKTLNLNDYLMDYNGLSGTSGQVLTSTPLGVRWTNSSGLGGSSQGLSGYVQLSTGNGGFTGLTGLQFSNQTLYLNNIDTFNEGFLNIGNINTTEIRLGIDGDNMTRVSNLVVEKTLNLNDYLLDYNGLSGTSGQVLTSTPLGVRWTNSGGGGTSSIGPTGPQGPTGPTGQQGPTGTSYDMNLAQIAIGQNARVSSTGPYSVAIGLNAGQTGQKESSVAIGNASGNFNQDSQSVAIGSFSGNVEQGYYCVAIGNQAGQNTQKYNSVSIGSKAGENFQQENAIAIGYLAGNTGQPANSIVLNASGSAVNGSTANAFYVNPVRQISGSGLTGVAVGGNLYYYTMYSPTNSEFVYFTF